MEGFLTFLAEGLSGVVFGWLKASIKLCLDGNTNPSCEPTPRTDVLLRALGLPGSKHCQQSPWFEVDEQFGQSEFERVVVKFWQFAEELSELLGVLVHYSERGLCFKRLVGVVWSEGVLIEVWSSSVKPSKG